MVFAVYGEERPELELSSNKPVILYGSCDGDMNSHNFVNNNFLFELRAALRISQETTWAYTNSAVLISCK